MQTALSLFDQGTANWFQSAIGTPTQVQAESWPAIHGGKHALISAPTGTGKTLAAFLVFIDRLKALARKGELEEKLYVIYISPLKSLGNDINQNLKKPLNGIGGPEINVAVRTGDTPGKDRQAMLHHPPHILITTPESLYLLLTSKGGRELLKPATAIIIDELHAMIGSKRGAHLMLSLARLDRLCGRDLQRIGLSATIRPLQTAADYLAAPKPVQIICPPMQKMSDIQVASAVPDMRVLPGGTIWPEFAQRIVDHCKTARTVLAFVEGRAQAERLAHAINLITSEGFSRTHHSCVSKEQRLEAENQLRSGQLRVLCATSSMELGIDVGEVDLVVQIGMPLTISSTLQRLGRAGHNPGRTSIMYMYPKMASETVTCALNASTALEGAIEAASPPRNCLDVLSQHLVSMAVAEDYSVDEALETVHMAHSFAGITKEDLQGVLRMLSGDFEHEVDRPVRPRLIYDRINGRVSGDAYSRMLAVSSGGTIPDRGWFPVTLQDGTRLGELDEEFVFEARIGDKFVLGAFGWRIQEIRKDRVIVSQASTEGAQPPFWKGDGQGRAYETGLAFGEKLRHMNDAQLAGRLPKYLSSLSMDKHCIENALRHINRQIEITGLLPDDKNIILEHFVDEAGEHQLMVHSIFGRRVNTILEMLLRRSAALQTGLDVRSFCEDDGFLLYLMGSRPLPEGLLHSLNPETAEETIRSMLPSTPLFSMVFRYNAARALMMGVRKGARQPLWVQRLRGAESLSTAIGQKGHPLIVESLRECCEEYLDIPAAIHIIRAVQTGEIRVHEMHGEAPSPMSLPLRRSVEMEMMYDYHPIPIAAHKQVQAALDHQSMMAPSKEQLELQTMRSSQPENEERLHALLMAEGDIQFGDVEAPVSWLESLSRQGRAAYIEPGLWIAMEQAALYESALEQGDRDAQLRIARRCLRYRGPHSAQLLSQRYLFDEELSLDLLEALVQAGSAVHQSGEYYHADLYERAQRGTVFARRQAIQTLPPENYAGLMASRTRHAGSPADQLKAGLHSLLHLPLPTALWEGAVLPLRTGGYRPQMLDEILQNGEYYWQMLPGERPQLAFYPYSAIDWEAEMPYDTQTLSADEWAVYGALKTRGASFYHSIAPLVSGDALPVLLSLAEKGLVHADSFSPVRQWLRSKDGEKSPSRQRVRQRVHTQQSGRWEISRPQRELSLEERIDACFERFGIACKETSGKELGWPQALELLRIQEYTGNVRRGYFIKGLSGAQFIRQGEFARLTTWLSSPLADVLWLNAADPFQLWGKALEHLPNRSFLNVPGTLVALKGGVPIMVLERQGETLRCFDPSCAAQALQALSREFEQKRLFPVLSRILIKEYDRALAPYLDAVGFLREMNDYVLWRKV